MLKIRDGIPKDIREVKSGIIKKRLFSLDRFKKSKAVMFYVSFGSEVETWKMMRDCLMLRKKVIVPYINGMSRALVPVQIGGLEELREGRWGIFQPERKRNFPLKDIDLVVVPGIAFDRKFFRIGFGKGYYDAFLKKTGCTKVGLCYESQITGWIDAERHDISMDMLITEKRIYRGVERC